MRNKENNFPIHTLIWSPVDHGISSTAILLPSADSRRVVVSYKQNYVDEVLVNRLVKLAQEKVWLDARHDHSC